MSTIASCAPTLLSPRSGHSTSSQLWPPSPSLISKVWLSFFQLLSFVLINPKTWDGFLLFPYTWGFSNKNFYLS